MCIRDRLIGVLGNCVDAVPNSNNVVDKIIFFVMLLFIRISPLSIVGMFNYKKGLIR